MFDDFEIQTDHLISAKIPQRCVYSVNLKNTYWVVNFAVSLDHRVRITGATETY